MHVSTAEMYREKLVTKLIQDQFCPGIVGALRKQGRKGLVIKEKPGGHEHDYKMLFFEEK